MLEIDLLLSSYFTLFIELKKAKTNYQRLKLEQEYNEYREFLHKKIKMAKRKYEKEVLKKCKNES